MQELIVFGEDWGRHPSSTQHLIHALKSSFQIYWINSIGLRRPNVGRTDIKRLWEKLQQTHQPTMEPAPFPVIAPTVIPLTDNPWLQKFNDWQLFRKLPPKQSHRTVWCTLPSAVDYLPILQADTVIYYCSDDFDHLKGVDHKRITKREQQLCQQADHIFCVSHPLMEKLANYHPQYLPHGVDLMRFAPQPTEPPSRPTVGFYGSLNEWLDQALLCELAKRRPNIEFELIGRQETNLSALTRRANIVIHPPCQHTELPKRLSRWHAALLPFLNNGQIHACNPLKLREYLASGCEVISPPFPSVMEYRHHLHLATSIDDWLKALDHCCDQSLSQHQNNRQQRIADLQHASWQHRAQQILSALKE